MSGALSYVCGLELPPFAVESYIEDGVNAFSLWPHEDETRVRLHSILFHTDMLT